MQFTDLIFLIGFLPIVLLLYQLLIHSRSSTRSCNLFLLGVSLLFYAFGSLKSLCVLLFILLWNWICVRAMQVYDSPDTSEQRSMRKTSLIFCVSINLLVLFLYKYFDTWIGSWLRLGGAGASLPHFVMPIGLSFYIFTSLSYVFDVYYHRAQPASLLDFGLFTAFFGRVNMGPVGHYAAFEEQLANHPVTMRSRKEGAALFLQGLMYKVILADNFALVFSALGSNTSWLGNLLLGFSYFFELYFDFCGYSRMARGLGAMFGFQIPKNFNQPYQARSVQEFWRRWHISLTDWFRDYVYIPLGGNRVDSKRWILNILCVWILTGIWHGSTLPFVVWGLYQGGLILLEKFQLNRLLEKAPAWIQHVWLILTQLIGWTFFAAPSLVGGLSRVGRYFGLGIAGFADSQALFSLYGSLALFALGIFFCTNWPQRLADRLKEVHGLNKGVLGALGYGLGFVICLALLISQTSQTFLYANF